MQIMHCAAECPAQASRPVREAHVGPSLSLLAKADAHSAAASAAHPDPSWGSSGSHLCFPSSPSSSSHRHLFIPKQRARRGLPGTSRPMHKCFSNLEQTAPSCFATASPSLVDHSRLRVRSDAGASKHSVVSFLNWKMSILGGAVRE